MIRILTALTALALLGACSTLEAVTDPVTGRATGLVGLALDYGRDSAFVLWANERGFSLPPECDRYAEIKQRDTGPSALSAAALIDCHAALNAMEQPPQASVEIIVHPVG